MHFEAKTEEQPLTPEQEAQLRQVVVDRAPAALAEVDAAATDDDLFYALPGAAFAAFHLEKFDVARELAQRAIDMAPGYRANWNYGNAIHAGHTVLGLLALRDGDLSLAAAELKNSGETPGSPQLGSFGPSMQLAKELLKRGQLGPVREYFSQCRKFWKMGGTWLDIWDKKIDAGEVPNFFMNCYR
jgi:tetratricopeptide (TPR) repeat protein